MSRSGDLVAGHTASCHCTAPEGTVMGTDSAHRRSLLGAIAAVCVSLAACGVDRGAASIASFSEPEPAPRVEEVVWRWQPGAGRSVPAHRRRREGRRLLDPAGRCASTGAPATRPGRWSTTTRSAVLWSRSEDRGSRTEPIPSLRVRRVEGCRHWSSPSVEETVSASVTAPRKARCEL